MTDEQGFTSRYNSFFRQLLFVGLLITLGVVVVVKLDFFVGGILGAVSMYVMLRSLYFRMTERWRWPDTVCALSLSILTFVLICGAVWLVCRVLATDRPQLDTAHVFDRVDSFLQLFERRWHVSVAPHTLWRDEGGSLMRALTLLLSTTSGFAVNTLLMPIVLYFMLRRARAMERTIERYQPFSTSHWKRIKSESKGIIYSNLIGIPLVMCCQGAVSLPVYGLLGVPHVVFWSFLTAVCGMVPLVGTAVVTVPMSLYLFFEVSPWHGVIMLLCAGLVIANADNLCRIYLMRRIVHTHPLIVVFGLFLGVPLFGFWGIVFGPLLVSGLLLLIRIYYREYHLLGGQEREDSTTRTG